jgi:iron complex transport system ATP-binding protein
MELTRECIVLSAVDYSMKPPSQSLIQCENLSCGYSPRIVLEGVIFDLKEGEVVALLGTNGSGKSTLLKTLSKSLNPLAGEIRITGKPQSQLSHRDLARLVAFVPQEEHSHFAFTALEVVLMGRLPNSTGLLDTKEDLELADKAMADADCLELRNRSIQELSGGEKQRVWLARALAQGGNILLLDEPSSHLDIAHQVQLVSILKALAAKGFGIITALHDLNLASVVADRALLLHNGKIAMDAAMQQVLASPMLEDAYGVQLEQVTDRTGRVRVFPIS